LPERWQWEFHRYQLVSSGARTTTTSEARSIADSLLPAKPDCQRGETEHSTATSLLPAKQDPLLTATPDPLLPAKPDLLLQAKPDPLLTPCSQQSQIVREVRVSIPPLSACSQQSQIQWHHRSQFHPYQRSQIHRCQLAPNKASFTPTIEARSTATSEASFTHTSEARSTATSLLPAKPDWQRGESQNSTATSLLPAKPDCLRGESDHSTAISFLPVKPDPLVAAKLVSPLPAKQNLLLPVCSQQSQIVRGESNHVSSETQHIRVWKVNMSELCQRADQWWKWASQSGSGSEYVRVAVEASMSELLQWACQSCGSELVGVMRVRVYACQSSK